MKLNKTRGPSLALALGCGLLTLENTFFVLTHGLRSAAWSERMTVDAWTYLHAGQIILASPNPWLIPETLHSTAMQYLMAALIWISGDRAPVVFKIIALCAWTGTWMLAGVLVKKTTSSTLSGWVAAFLCAFSLALSRYCGIVQYEVLVAFLGLALVWSYSSEMVSDTRAIGGGLIGLFLAFFRAHFAIEFVLILLMRLIRDKSSFVRPALVSICVFTAIAVPLNMKFTRVTGYPIVFQEVMYFQSSLNPNSSGVNFPHERQTQPAGPRFIIDRPGAYLHLLGRRFLYFSGLKPDIWFIESRWSAGLQTLGIPARGARCLLLCAELALLLAGLAWARSHSMPLPGSRPKIAWLMLAAPIAVTSAQFFINSSARFLVPAIPELVCLQALGLAGLLRRRQ